MIPAMAWGILYSTPDVFSVFREVRQVGAETRQASSHSKYAITE